MKKLPLLLAALAFLVPAAPTRAATIGFAPSTTVAAVGDSFSVDVVVSGLGGEIVSAYDLDIVFDTSVLSADSVSPSSALGDAAAFEAIYASSLLPGIVDVAGVSLLSDATLLALQGGDVVTLATLGFTKIGAGSSSLDFVFDAVNDVKGSRAQILSLAVAPGSIGPGAVVPEPGAAVTFGAGLLVTGWALRGRRR